MEITEIRLQFNEKVNELIETKRHDNKAFLNAEEYTQQIAKLKHVKTALSTRGSKRKSTFYRTIRKYDVITISGKERLIRPVSESELSTVLYYATNDQLFDIIHSVHLEIEHGGRNRMAAKINKLYCNITKETIMIYLRLCTQCNKRTNSIKKRLVSKPVLHSNLNSRAHVDFIDMQQQMYNGYRFVMVYQDHLTKFVLLKALRTNAAQEVATNLLEIFTIFGAPLIIYSDYGREFVNSVLVDLHAMWPEVKIVNGKPANSQNQGYVERRDMEEKLGAWMHNNKTIDWPYGLKFVQFKKNRDLDTGLGQSAYEAMFGRPVRIGLASAGVPLSEINNFSNEEDIEKLLGEIDADIEDLKGNSDSD